MSALSPKTQADRVAQSSPIGRELLAFVRRPEIVAKLREAAERGTQPAAAISADIMESFPSVSRDPAMKRKLGYFVATVLDGEGYVVLKPNVRMRNPLFASGALYRKRAAEAAPVDLLSRLASALTEAEAERTIEALLLRFPELRRAHR